MASTVNHTMKMSGNSNDPLLRVTLRTFSDAQKIRVLESIERFQLEGYEVKIVSNYFSDELRAHVIVTEGPSSSLTELAKYIEAVEKLAREWKIPTQD